MYKELREGKKWSVNRFMLSYIVSECWNCDLNINLGKLRWVSWDIC